jgi:hypothetical protein
VKNNIKKIIKNRMTVDGVQLAHDMGNVTVSFGKWTKFSIFVNVGNFYNRRETLIVSRRNSFHGVV